MPDREDVKMAEVKWARDGWGVECHGKRLISTPPWSQAHAEVFCDGLNKILEAERDKINTAVSALIEKERKDAAAKALERAADIGKAHTMLFTRADPAFVTTYEIEIRSLAARYAKGEEGA